MKPIYIITISFFLSSFTTIYGKETVTEDQRKIAKLYAEEFGVESISSIKIDSSLHMPIYCVSLVVRGDEKFKNGTGQYKQLEIPLDRGSISLGYCSLSIHEYVEIDLENTIRISVTGISRDEALSIIRRFFSEKHSYSSDLDKTREPPESVMKRPTSFAYKAWEKKYYIDFGGMYLVYFRITEDEIIITDYVQYII